MRRMVVAKFMALSGGAYHTPDRFPVEATTVSNLLRRTNRNSR